MTDLQQRGKGGPKTKMARRGEQPHPRGKEEKMETKEWVEEGLAALIDRNLR
jgi:hypothetical protein